MRFVDAIARGRVVARVGAPVIALVVAISAVLGGCAAVGDSAEALQRSLASPAPKEAPVSLATQRAFDDASRALKAGRHDDAERRFRALSQANPELGGPHANLGVIYRQAGKLAEAATEFERAAQLNPKQAVYFNQLGVTYRQQGRFDKARAAYERAIALDADYAAPALNLGILNDLYLGDAIRALDLYARYLALTPNGDPTVAKWVAELKNRKPATVATGRKEKA